MARRLVPLAPILCIIAACAPAMRGTPGSVRIVVHNPGEDAVMARACGPAACSGFRQLDAHGRTTFMVDPAGGSRAVVEGKRGDRFVARHPVDFTAGETYHVEMAPNL